MLVSVATIFGSKLKELREAKGLSGYRLAMLSGLPQPLEYALEQGKRPPSQANLEALSSVEELGVQIDVLQAWADADRIGLEGIERIKKHAPELLALPTSNKRQGNETTIAFLGRVREGRGVTKPKAKRVRKGEAPPAAAGDGRDVGTPADPDHKDRDHVDEPFHEE